MLIKFKNMFNKKIIFISAFILIAVLSFTLFYISNGRKNNPEVSKDFKNAKYVINNKFIELETSSYPNKGSTVKYFGNQIESDINGDGIKDITFLALDNKSNTFYVLAAINTGKGYIGSKGYMLGTNISPQTTVPGNQNTVEINYAEKDTMDSNVSNGKTLRLTFNNLKMEFENIENGLNGNQGEPDKTLISKEWILEKAIYNDGKEFLPKKQDSFSIMFDKNGTFSAKTDCNNIGGNYVYNENQLSFKDIVHTEKYCALSEEKTFIDLIENTQTYLINNDGKLILNLRFDTGSVIFK